MKTIEEKAKAYDEALERAKVILNDYEERGLEEILFYAKEDLGGIFPELKESEDEKIRKAIIYGLKYLERELSWDALDDVDILDAYDWLEKQGESYTKKDIDDAYLKGVCDAKSELEKQGGIDNCPLECSTNTVMTDSKKNQVEPKFKVGDWVVNNITKDVFLIKSINNGYCTLEDIKGNIISPCLPPLESESHLWSIEDAKDGDVLVDEDINVIGIFEGIEGMCWHSKFYYSNTTKEFYGIDCGGSHRKKFAKPATKEQRDTLMKAITDAGYEWDAEKKELKLLITNGGDFFESENREQKSAWSYEDEANLNNIIWLCNNCIKGSETTWIPAQAKKIKHLIETIKERGLLQQNPIEWSEEDETGWTNTMIMIKECTSNHYTKDSIKLVIDWLESIKQRIGG